jgi:hypothetical protein
METREENALELDLIRSGRNFLGILNDLKWNKNHEGKRFRKK